MAQGLEDKYIDKVSCGSNHVLALTSDGQVYSWGLNFVGQLGHGKISGPEVEAKLVSSLLPNTASTKRSKSREAIGASSDSYGGARTSR